jgi:hypothetical protein
LDEVSQLPPGTRTKLGTLHQLRGADELVVGPVLIRLELPDRPGSLAIVAGVLASCGVNILRLEVIGQHDGNAIDEFLLEGGDLELALFRLGPYVRVIEQAPQRALPDPGVAMAEACKRIAGARSAERATEELLHSALALVRADEGVLLERYRDDWLSPVAATVAGLGSAHVGELPHARTVLETARAVGVEDGEPWAPPRYLEYLRGNAAALIPVGSRPHAIVAIVRSNAVPFASAELERLESLSRYAHGVLAELESTTRRSRAGEGAGAARG